MNETNIQTDNKNEVVIIRFKAENRIGGRFVPSCLRFKNNLKQERVGKTKNLLLYAEIVEDYKEVKSARRLAERAMTNLEYPLLKRIQYNGEHYYYGLGVILNKNFELIYMEGTFSEDNNEKPVHFISTRYMSTGCEMTKGLKTIFITPMLNRGEGIPIVLYNLYGMIEVVEKEDGVVDSLDKNAKRFISKFVQEL